MKKYKIVEEDDGTESGLGILPPPHNATLYPGAEYADREAPLKAMWFNPECDRLIDSLYNMIRFIRERKHCMPADIMAYNMLAMMDGTLARLKRIELLQERLADYHYDEWQAYKEANFKEAMELMRQWEDSQRKEREGVATARDLMEASL